MAPPPGPVGAAIERFWSVVLVECAGRNGRSCLAGRRAKGLLRRISGLARGERSGAAAPAAGRDLSRPPGQVAGRPRRQGASGHAGPADRRRPAASRARWSWPTARDGSSTAAIVAVPWRNVRSLLAENLLAAMPALADVERIEPAAITAVHLWFDRPITPLPHAVLVGRLSQWVFVEAVCGAGDSGAALHYCQVVISASHRLPERKHDELLAEVRRELEAIWPAVRACATAARPGGYAAGGRVFGAAGSGSLPPAAADAHRESRLGGRLDSHRLARHDGRGRSQRLSGGGSAANAATDDT